VGRNATSFNKQHKKYKTYKGIIKPYFQH